MAHRLERLQGDVFVRIPRGETKEKGKGKRRWWSMDFILLMYRNPPQTLEVCCQSRGNLKV